MITQVNATNNDKYTILFAKVNEKLGLTEEDKIHTLSQYFGKLAQIATIAQSDLDYSLLRLPLDEEPCYINLNDRSITIPDAFKRAGLGIKDDEAVETIYFAVDPFFDTISIHDLEIAIEWENANGDKGLTAGIFRQYDNISGKYIFGWPLTSAVTSTVGTVKFSVRFYKLTEDTTAYVHNLSTTAAELAVRDSLVTKITGNTEIDQWETELLKRVVSSTLVGTPVAKTPYFVNVAPDANSSHRNKGLMVLGENNTYTDITEDNNSVQNINTVLYVLGGRGDTGALDYKWYFKAPGAEKAVEIDSVPVEEYRQGTFYDSGLVYYVQNEDGTYSEFKDTTTDLETSIADGQYYNRYSTYVLGEGLEDQDSLIGEYYAVATNTLMNDKASAATIVCKIEGPTKVVFVEGITPSFIELSNVNNGSNDNLTNNANKDNKVTINSQTPEGSIDKYYWSTDNSTFTETESAEHTITSEGTHYYYVKRFKNGGKVESETRVIEAVYRPIKGNAGCFEIENEVEIDGVDTIPADTIKLIYTAPSADGHAAPNRYTCLIKDANTGDVILSRDGYAAGVDGVFTFGQDGVTVFDEAYLDKMYVFEVTAYKGSKDQSSSVTTSKPYKIREAGSSTATTSYTLPRYNVVD